jgi:hypothetical protein
LSSSSTTRYRSSIAAGLVLALLAGCSNSDDAERIAELESEIADLREQQQLAATTSTQPDPSNVTTSTTAQTLTLTAAQRVYCDDLTSVVYVPSGQGGVTPRPETILFLEIADQLGYLPAGETPETLVRSSPSGVVDPDVGDYLRLLWAMLLRVQESDIDFDEVYTAVCLEAWELR